HAGKLFFPVGIVLRGIGVNSLVLSAVNRQIGLPVAFKIERAHLKALLYGSLEDGGQDLFTVAQDFPRNSNLHGNQRGAHSFALLARGVDEFAAPGSFDSAWKQRIQNVFCPRPAGPTWNNRFPFEDRRLPLCLMSRFGYTALSLFSAL